MGVIDTIVGAMLSRVLQLLGKLEFHTTQWKFGFVHQDSWGGKLLRQTAKGAKSAEFEARMDIFNGYHMPTGLRDMRVEFRAQRRQLACDEKLIVKVKPPVGN